MSSIKASKQALRKEIAVKIQQLTNEEKRTQTEKILEKLFALEDFKKSRRISVYLSTENEINTKNIVQKIFDSNKQCYVPRCNKQIMEMVKLNDMKDWASLPRDNKYKIQQPSLSDIRDNALESGGLDLIILPGVAFTIDGKRLGHGKGYYDSFQSSLFQQQQTRPKTIGIAFKEQILPDIPTDEHDVKLDLVLFPN